MKIRAKKSLGQNFLIDNNILKIIVDCAEIEDKEILEVGPGTGNLTNEILKKKPKRLFLIEKDNNLINVSRSVIYASTGKDWKEAAREKARTFNLNLGSGI